MLVDRIIFIVVPYLIALVNFVSTLTERSLYPSNMVPCNK